VIVTLGFTESDRDHDYSSFSNGYRLGARQLSVTIALEGDGTGLSGEQRAEKTFTTSNYPRLALTYQTHQPADPNPLRRSRRTLGSRPHRGGGRVPGSPRACP
jgi:hypothetical protein